MKLDPKTTAVLTLDFQKGILGMVPGSDSVIETAAKVVACARKNKFLLIHVGLGFNEGHPEIPEHAGFSQIKQNNLFVKGTPSAEFDSRLAQSHDLLIYKQRVSGFSQNQLEMILRANGIKTLVLFGVATSGIVLSTLRQAFDLDYKSVVIKDACADGDAEVHRVLTEKVFLRQATVTTADAFIAEQG